jgi:mRNA interferase MazF
LVTRGEIWWAELDDPIGSVPGFSRPVIIVSADHFNTTSIATITVVFIYSNLTLSRHPGNLLLASRDTGLDRDSVANVSQIGTIDKQQARYRMGAMPPSLMARLDDGLRLALQL